MSDYPDYLNTFKPVGLTESRQNFFVGLAAMDASRPAEALRFFDERLALLDEGLCALRQMLAGAPLTFPGGQHTADIEAPVLFGRAIAIAFRRG
jgi:hypothetical protein